MKGRGGGGGEERGRRGGERRKGRGGEGRGERGGEKGEGREGKRGKEVRQEDIARKLTPLTCLQGHTHTHTSVKKQMTFQ